MADIDWSKGSLSGPDGKPVDTTDWSSGVLTEPPKPVGGFGASAKQALGSLVKGAGQAAEDFLPASIGKDNAVKKYGQSVIDANPTAVQGFSDIADSPWMAAKEATGNAAGSMGSMLGLRALGMGITAASPLTGPFAPATALAGQAVANVGPFVAAALPSFGGIREKQIAKDPNSTASMQDKALAAAGAGTVGLIEGKFGPQAWAMKAMTKEGRAQLAKGLAETTLAKGVGYGALKGAAVEGAEELVQNPIEQLAAYEDPRTPHNIKETLFGGAMGAIGGGVLGGATGAANQMLDRTQPAAPNQAPTDQAPPLQLGNTPDPLLSFPDGTVARRSEIDAYINGLPADQQPAARAKAMGLAPQPGTPEPVVKPSEAMGLDPAAGPLSAAAVTAVDTGAHQEIQLQQASEADQAAYQQATAEQDRQAAELDTATKPITHGPIAEAAMSDEDKRAVLFSNQAVADGGKRYAGTLDGDILNGLGKPYPNRLAAARRANMEGKDWTIAQVQDGFVARRKNANDSTEVQPGDTGSTGVRSTDSPASVGVGATDGNGVGAQPRRSPDAVLDHADQLPKRVDAAPVVTVDQATRSSLQRSPVSPHPMGEKSILSQDVDNRASTDAKSIGDIGRSKAFVEKGFDGLDADAVSKVKSGMLAIGKDTEILNAVIKLIPVNVVDNLMRNKITPEMLFHDPSMLGNPGIGRDSDVSIATNDAATAAVQAITRIATETGFTRNNSGRSAGEGSPAMGTLDGRHVVTPTSDDVLGAVGGETPSAPPTVSNNSSEVQHDKAPSDNPALDRIAKGKGWFGNAIKAQQFVAQNGLKDTHEVIKTSATRWDVKAKAHQPQEQPNGTTPAQAITPTTQREAQAPDASQRLTPAQAGKLQEAHKAHGLDVTLKTVQKMHDRVMKSLITGKGSNGGVEYNIKPKERKELQAQADRLANDLSLFGVQQEAASPTPAPVAPKSLREVVDRKRAEKAKPAEPPAEQPAPAQASSSRPGEPTAEQIESVGDVVRITKSAGKEIKRTVNASTAMKTLNERAEALQMLAEKCK